MPRVGAERQVQQFGGQLLRGGGLDVGVIERTVQLGLARRRLQQGDGFDLANPNAACGLRE